VEERFVNEAIAASEKKKIGEYVSTAGEYIWVKTSDGIIALSKVQIAGKKSMSSEEFLRGHRLEF
jgi:methionyl-tRNA formyltransferase